MLITPRRWSWCRETKFYQAQLGLPQILNCNARISEEWLLKFECLRWLGVQGTIGPDEIDSAEEEQKATF